MRLVFGYAARKENIRGTAMPKKQPKMIPNPLWCGRCEGRGYLVTDAEWEPYAVQCPDCPSNYRAAPMNTGASKLNYPNKTSGGETDT